MADLPRWVDRGDVDSSAMLGAFLKYHKEMNQGFEMKQLSYQPIWEGQLFAVTHRDPPEMSFLGAVRLPMPCGIPEVPCRQRACSRCEVRGGYIFRWYSPYWARDYNDARRPGAWKAPEPELPDCRVHEQYLLQQLRFWNPRRESTE